MNESCIRAFKRQFVAVLVLFTAVAQLTVSPVIAFIVAISTLAVIGLQSDSFTSPSPEDEPESSQKEKKTRPEATVECTKFYHFLCYFVFELIPGLVCMNSKLPLNVGYKHFPVYVV